MEKQLVLVIDDEKPIREAIAAALEDAGYTVAEAYSAEEADNILAKKQPDLILLDLMLPGESGLDFCRRFRAESDIPIIIISAKGEEVDKVLGLELGADDYVAKPFGIHELVSRVRAHLRRKMPQAAPQQTLITIDDLKIDTENRQTFLNENPVQLTNAEFQVLALLAKNLSKNFSRKEILETIWGKDAQKDERIIDVYIHKLREKIESNPQKPKYLVTAHGLGYRLGEQR